MKRTHIASYEFYIGPVPAGKKLDHLCRTRKCCNPEHLEPVTNKVNIARGVSPSALHGRQTECKRGHPFTEANTWVRKEGWRQCRACRAAQQTEQRKKGKRRDQDRRTA